MTTRRVGLVAGAGGLMVGALIAGTVSLQSQQPSLSLCAGAGGTVSVKAKCSSTEKSWTIPPGPPGPPGPVGPAGPAGPPGSSGTGSSAGAKTSSVPGTPYMFALPFEATVSNLGPDEAAFAIINGSVGTAGSLGGYKSGVHGTVSRAATASGSMSGVVGHNRNFAETKGVGGIAGGKNGVAIYGQAEEKDAFAGFFRGKVTIQGPLVVSEVYAAKGTVGGAAKLFKIDHPLDPAEKYLMHASVESDERRNMYDGVITLDASGAGSVRLPDWFEALNRDFRYQLTCIGGSAPVYIAEEVRNNRFRIAGGKPGLKVSWQVTGVRQDGWARANPFLTEERKTGAERGRYLHPAELGFAPALLIGKDAVRGLVP